MKILCKIENADCPQNLKICCMTCEHSGTCPDCCSTRSTPKDCTQSLYVTDEMAHFESTVPDVIANIVDLINVKKDIEEQEKLMKQKLLEAMETYDVKSFENDVIKMTYVAPTTRSTLDSARLKKDHPDIVEEYSKVSNVAASVRVTVK